MVMEATPPDVLVWAETVLGDRIVGVELMVGGIDARTVRLALDDGVDVVLRLTEPDHDEDIDYLAQVLDRLARTPIPAPLRLAHAMAVGEGHVPLMLQTLLVGDPTIPVEPDDAWLSGLVQTIVGMQQIEPEPWMHDRAAVRWKELEQIPADELGAADLVLLRRLRDLAASAPLTRVFGHDDFWPGNTLRDGVRVVGVVDWGDAGLVSVARGGLLRGRHEHLLRPGRRGPYPGRLRPAGDGAPGRDPRVERPIRPGVEVLPRVVAHLEWFGRSGPTRAGGEASRRPARSDPGAARLSQ